MFKRTYHIEADLSYSSGLHQLDQRSLNQPRNLMNRSVRPCPLTRELDFFDQKQMHKLGSVFDAKCLAASIAAAFYMNDYFSCCQANRTIWGT